MNRCHQRETDAAVQGIPAGPISLPTDATFVSDADEEIFLLYTRLAALRPADGSDAGHFHGLGSENSREDSLLVHIELKKPPPPSTVPTGASEPSLTSSSSRRNRGKKKKREEGPQSGSDVSIRRGEPVVLEYRLFQNITALRSRSGDTGSVLWKSRLCVSVFEPPLLRLTAQLSSTNNDFSIEFLSLVLRQLHFPEPTQPTLFHYEKLRQAHVLELGCVYTAYLPQTFLPSYTRISSTRHRQIERGQGSSP